MIHSEQNAIYNAASATKGCTAYVTGKCCHLCLMALHQAGAAKVIMADRGGWKKDGEEERNWSRFAQLTSMQLPFRVEKLVSSLGVMK